MSVGRGQDSVNEDVEVFSLLQQMENKSQRGLANPDLPRKWLLKHFCYLLSAASHLSCEL